ncbi:type 1 glutamine amidotransferase family protein [Fulvivirga lutea]|uniref:Glutamine amidotransferase n=1 Tax=Fulvivirga lutea TaxID=2810512 RepID=A0A975A2M6_9BACT|nr:type 1 glutamine amidotransferase family protein [Fulvivirga lutea]QSE98697.1 glutamine amidotransferase [Fulvivirga lutea]
MDQISVYIFLFTGFSDWEISYLTPELQTSEKIDLKYFSVDGKPIKSMGGLTIMPDYSIEQVTPDQISLLILPGGAAWEDNSITGIDELTEKLHTENKTIGAICGATTYLARKGYLNNLNHTSNALFYLQNFAKEYNGANNYVDELAVTDQNLITANGIGPIEFAREVFKKVDLHSEEKIEKWFKLFKNGEWSE